MVYSNVTDSMVNAIMVVNVEEALHGNCVISTIPMDPDTFQSVNGESLASGTSVHVCVYVYVCLSVSKP